MLQTAACQTANYIAALFLPVLTVVSGMMGKSLCRTHRREIDMEEPNILWTCVAAPPGNSDFGSTYNFYIYNAIRKRILFNLSKYLYRETDETLI